MAQDYPPSVNKKTDHTAKMPRALQISSPNGAASPFLRLLIVSFSSITQAQDILNLLRFYNAKLMLDDADFAHRR